MKTNKYIITLLLLIMAAGVMGQGTPFQYGDLWYETLPGTQTVKVVYNNSYSGDIKIPATVTNASTTYAVTEIGDLAFNKCSGLTSIIIPNSVKAIGNGAFKECPGLKSITIPNSVKTIGEYAFSVCSSLTSITIPNSVETIGEGAFLICSNLKTLTFQSETPPLLGVNMFYNATSLATITVPYGTKDAYETALRGKLILSGLNPQFIEAPKPVPPAPPVTFNWYKVTVPAVEGVIFVRNGKEHQAYDVDVMEDTNFTFFLKTAEGYPASSFTVTTSRNGETLEPQDTDGRYVLKEINQDVTIYINPVPTANQPILPDGTRISKADGALRIDVLNPQNLRICNPAGATVYSATLHAGSNTIPLTPGIYLLLFENGAVRKVAL